ncbi:MAG: tetratricopeptide repeat protein [Nitrospirales bacterium]
MNFLCHNLEKRHSSCRARLSLILLATPLLILSCGTAPKGKLASIDSPSPVSAPTRPEAYYHFLRGYLTELANQPIQAIEEYRKGLRVDPDSIFLKTRMAKLYFSNGEMATAVEMADTIPLSSVDDVSGLLELAKIYAGTGHSDKALLFLDRVIEKEPTHDKGYISKGMLLLSLKRPAEAKAVLEAAVVQVPQSPEIQYYLGMTMNEEGRVEEAESYYEQAIALRKSFRRAYLSLGSLHEAHKNSAKAIHVYERYLQAGNPHDKDIRLQLVRLYLQSQSHAQALEQLSLILDYYPNDLNAQVRVALIYGEMGNYQQAIDELTNILGTQPNELRVRDYLGLMYEEMKDYKQAKQTYEANLKINPNYYDTLLHLGFLSYRQKQYEEALSHLSHAKTIQPKRSEPHLLLGLTYLQQEEYSVAITQFEEGIQQDPTNADLHFNLGTTYDKLGRFEDVVREMERTLNLEPEHADALNYLGYSYADRGVEVEKALELTQRAVELKPNNGYYVDSLGWALFKVGRSAEALVAIDRALSLVSDDPVIFEHLGEIHLQRKEREKAQKAWARAIELDASNENLIKRFRAQGFGDPGLTKTLPPELPKISHSTSEHTITP